MKKSILSVVLCLAMLLTSIGGLFVVPVFAANETNLLDEGNTLTDNGTATHTLEDGVLTVTAAAAGDYVEITTANGAMIADQCFIGISITSDVLFEVEMRDTNWFKVGFASDNPWAFAGNESTAGINPGTYNDVMFDLTGSYKYNGASKDVPLMSVRVIAKAAGTITISNLVQSDNMNLVDITTANYAGIDGLNAEYNLIGGFAEDWTSNDAQGSSAVVEYDDAGALTVSSTAGAWPAACYDFETPIVVPADSVIAADYTVYQTGRVAIFFGESDINNYESGEYVDISTSTGAGDIPTSQYKGYQLLSDIIPAESIDADGNVTINSVKIWAIGTGKCVKVNELKVLYAEEVEPEVGTYENPYQLDFGMFGRAIVYLEPGAEAYVQAADANGTIVSAYGANEDLEDAVDGWFVQYGRQTVYPEGANASFEMNPFSDIFSVMNTSETEGRTIYFSLEEAPKGNIGTFESGSDVAVENVDGAYVVVGGDYITVTDGMEVANRFVATEDGTLTFSIFAENWFYVINNITSGVYGDGQWSDSDPVMDTYELEVAAGDEIQIIINTYDAMNPWAAPEGSIEWSLTFEAAGSDYVCTHDGLVHMDATEAGCHMNGCIEHWVCYDCETVWQDEALTQITNIKNVVIPATGEGNLVHFDAVEAGCHMNGNVEYWVCYDCEQVWTDEALTQLSNIKNVIVPAVGGDVIHVEAKDATCYENGNVEHWYCETCEQVWADEALTQLTNHKNVVIGATHTNLVHMDATEAGCHMNGCVEHWVCYDCGGVWTNELLTEVSNIKNVVIPAVGGDVIHVEAKDATCYENGNVEHWYCETCEQVWADEALTQLTNHKNVVIGATHTNLVHMDATEAGCHMNGCVEHWVCYDCGGVWTNELLTEVSNIKNVVIPAVGGDVIHVEAKDPTATEDGNIEHWYCETCEQVWQDEALTQLTNHKNVIIPATGEEEPELNELARLFYYVNGLVELTEEELVGMDVNNDGVINLFDAARVFYYVNGVIDEL